MSALRKVRSGLKLPPFGKELMDLRRQGLVPKPLLGFGHILVAIDDWTLGKGVANAALVARVVVPEDAEPHTLDFLFVAGLTVLVAYRPSRTMPDRLNAIILQLLRFRPLQFRVVDMDRPAMGFLVKSSSVGIERKEWMP